MEIQIEFGGFYGYHDEYIEQRIETYNDYGDELDFMLKAGCIDLMCTAI
jgi:hypothetical protein